MDRRDRFLGDSFSESGAKVNCVMFRACVPYACVFQCIPVCVCVCAWVKPHFTCVHARNDAFAGMGVLGYGCVKCCRMCRVRVFLPCVIVYCIIWLCVGSWDYTKSAPY